MLLEISLLLMSSWLDEIYGQLEGAQINKSFVSSRSESIGHQCSRLETESPMIWLHNPLYQKPSDVSTLTSATPGHLVNTRPAWLSMPPGPARQYQHLMQHASGGGVVAAGSTANPRLNING
jgi:hypothetical protein